jgi:hypothetical protein
VYIITTLLCAAICPTASALTGAEVLEKMNADQRSGYLAGNIDMAAQLSFHDGRQERSTCIFNWYYEQGGVTQVVQAIERFKDRQVQPVIYALITRACGE